MNNNNFLDVIKFEGDNNSIVSKSIIEDFNTKTQLIVNESQEAIFYKDGQALDLFKSGRHSLTTDNLPFFRKLFSKVFKDKTPFACEVFFINKVNVLDLMWGTATPIVIEDPKYHLIVSVRANGQTGIRVIDSRKFVIKLVGQLKEFTIDDVKSAIKGLMMTYVKDAISKTIVDSNTSVLDVNSKLVELSSIIQGRLNEALEDLGIETTKFFVNTIACGENDLKKLVEVKEKYLQEMTQIEIDTMRTVKMGEALAKSRETQGFTYQEERKYDVLQQAAGNEGNAGNLMGAGIGLGMGAGLGAGMAGAAKETTEALNAKPTSEGQSVTCPECGAKLPFGSKFCSECGKPLPTKKFCPNCGAKIEGNAKFCSECGHKL